MWASRKYLSWIFPFFCLAIMSLFNIIRLYESRNLKPLTYGREFKEIYLDPDG